MSFQLPSTEAIIYFADNYKEIIASRKKNKIKNCGKLCYLEILIMKFMFEVR